MSPPKLAALIVLALPILCAQPALPELRIEPTTGGSVFYIRNTSVQPVTAYLIELVDYPGSSFSFWQDDAASELIAPGAEKRIPIGNMTVGAVPEYVKMRAALYADGTSSGIPEKIAQLIEHRRFLLQTTRELIAQLDKAGAKPAAIMALKQWAESLPAPTKTNRGSTAALNNVRAKALIERTLASLDANSLEDVLQNLRASEQRLAASKPAL